MFWHQWALPILFVATITLLTPLAGRYLAMLFSPGTPYSPRFLRWLEHASYRAAGIDPTEQMTWHQYAAALLWFNGIGLIVVFALQLLQDALPLNPQKLPATAWPLAFNTAASFVTNTNWQAYAGETTLSYLTQMAGLAVQNFVSAATGLAVAIALIRGLAARTATTLGNFWSDLVRATVYLFLPLSLILAPILVYEGVIQNLSPYAAAETLEGATQIIPQGPVASQIAIKQLGTNGGGFFNANSAHPFENPTLLSNWLEMIAIVLVPAASIYAYGVLIGSMRHGWYLYLTMLILWGAGAALSFYAQQQIMHGAPSPLLEGIEMRLGNPNTLLWSTMTTATSNGSVNGMLSSLSPLAGGVALFNIMLGELIFGGVGVGLCSLIMFILLTVFLCGLMVGRTPEYLGKKIEKREIKWVVIAVLTPGAMILIGAGISSILPDALGSLANHGPHGLSEILYAFSSAAGNNGSAFAGLNANTDYYNINLGIIMLVGRLAIIVPSLAVAGLLAAKRYTPPSLGTFSTNSLLFFVLLVSVILIFGALTFFPALILGPIVEHMLMLKGVTF